MKIEITERDFAMLIYALDLLCSAQEGACMAFQNRVTPVQNSIVRIIKRYKRLAQQQPTAPCRHAA
jgi:hypothetical protein